MESMRAQAKARKQYFGAIEWQSCEEDILFKIELRKERGKGEGRDERDGRDGRDGRDVRDE